ncbi:MAG: ParB/RepB/Spo0J family partition protein [Nitrospirota bacterium]|nr:ParB/RepB/Spo0J family partition protein [Nitrospirota bacterium]
MEKRALGKGLDALLPTGGTKPSGAGGESQQVPIEQIIPNRYQPRTDFHETELNQLADSLKQHGILQPLVVRRKGDGFFELIAGERRLRAAKLAGMRHVPVTIRNSTDEQALILALLENLQREDLNPMEAARAYQRMAKEFGLTQDIIAQQIGKDRSSIANIARLANLPNEIQSLVESGQLSSGHAKVLLSLTKMDAQLKLARHIVSAQLSVRQAERLANSQPRAAKPKRLSQAARAYPDVEERLQRRLGTRVSIVKGRSGGQIQIDYFTPAELDRLVELLLG